MNDIYQTTCRICLEDGAIYPIFESTEEFEGVYAKLAVSLQEKIEDTEGYPRNICLKCKNTSETICNFIAKFQKTCNVLKDIITQVKSETLDDFSIEVSDNEPEPKPFVYELQLDNKYFIKPKAEKRDAAEILESLSHLTVKKIKVENGLHSQETCNKDKNSIRKRRDRPKQADSMRTKKSAECKTKAKTEPKNANKPAARQKPENKPVMAKKAAARPKPGAGKKPEGISKVDRPEDLNKKQENEENSINKIVLCDNCGATFTETKYLQKHIQKHHIGRQFKCKKCPKEFFRENDLENHKKRHENIRAHVCDTCGKAFYDRKTLNAHNNYVHKKIRKKPRVYQCKYCDRSYTHKRGIVIHERSAHTGERPDVCDICGSSFFDMVYLREHMRLHTGAAPYKCPVCARGYAQRGNMKSHMRNHRISELDPDTKAQIKHNYFKFMRP